MITDAANRSDTTGVWSLDGIDPDPSLADLYDMDHFLADGIMTVFCYCVLSVSVRDFLLGAVMVSRAVISRILWIVPQSLTDHDVCGLLLSDSR